MLLPFPWFMAFLFAAAIHECGHLAAIVLAGSKVLEIRIGAAGAKILAAPQSEHRNLLCCLAGPAASLSLLLLVHIFPRIAICGFVQGMYNLLPFPAMDGGQIIRAFHVKDFIKNKKRL